MAIPAAIMMAGTALQIVNGWAANMERAEAEKQNADFYRKQAEYAAVSQVRATAIAEIDYSTKLGAQVGAYASGNVDVSGSAVATVGGTIKNAIDEIRAIKIKGEMEQKLASLKGLQSQQYADTLSSVGYNLMQAGQTGLSNYASSEGFGKGFPSFLQGGTPPSAQGSPAKYFPQGGY